MTKCNECRSTIARGKAIDFSSGDIRKLQKTYKADDPRSFYDQKFCSEKCKKAWIKDYCKPLKIFNHPWWDPFGIFTDGL